MLQALLLAALAFVQDPKPAKTVEERLKELSDRIAVLDKQASDLAAENHDLQVKLTQRDAARESGAKGTAAIWMKRHTGGLSLTEKQSAEIEALWVGWTREDFQKRADEATWKARESMLREKLTAEQVPRLEKAVRAELESSAKGGIASYWKQAQVAPERGDAFVRTVMTRVSFDGVGLIPQAHPGTGLSWIRLYEAVEASVPDLSAVLTPEEQTRVARFLLQWGTIKKQK